ncbi:MAG: type II secretion system F family protein [Candidatus Omnitrophota bacterium]
MLLVIYIFLAAAAALVIIGISGSIQPGARRAPLPHPQANRPRVSFSFSQKLLEKLKLDVKIKNKLAAAHVMNITAGQFFDIRLALLVIAGSMSFLLLKKIDPPVMLIFLALAYLIPDLWLKRKISQRKYEIARVLPETVDLLGLCVEAGLDFTTAVKWVIEKKVSANPMVEELALVLDEIKWGKPRSQALKDMAKRLNVPEVSSFVQALVQAERMGTPVGEAFGIISEDTRLQRFRRGERYALQAPIKILLPLIFCILPVIGIIIGGPILLQFTQGGLFTGFAK